jgi:hypothetical protein
MEEKDVAQLEKEKTELEIEKLRIENRHLQKPLLKTSSFYIVFIPLIISLFLNIYQIISNNREMEQKDAQFNLERERLASENNRNDLEIQQIERRLQILGITRDSVNKELSQVRKDLILTDQQLFEHQLKYMQLTTRGVGNNEATKNDIERERQSVEFYKYELEKYIKRRSELEQLLVPCN